MSKTKGGGSRPPESHLSQPSRFQAALGPFANFFSRLPPARLVFLGYLIYGSIGWLLLSLPLSVKRNTGAGLDHLFVSISALSTTGLSTLSVSDDYTWFGQVVILALIQVGGLGYMTLGSFILLSRKNELSGLRAEIGRAVFSLPAGFRIDKFIRSVIRFTVVIELMGVAAFYFLFWRAGVKDPLWSAVFHSVSSFCTAGFSLYNNSFESFAGDFWINLVIALLSYAGAIGFIVFVDYWRMARGKAEQVTMTSKIIVGITIWLSIIGTALIFLGEPSLQKLPAADRLIAAFFQCMTAMTTVGFNTVPIGGMAKASLLVLIVLMVIGASPAGTGGGLKTTTFSAVLGVMRSAMTGGTEVRFWSQTIPLERIWMALASAGFYLAALVIGTYLLSLTETSSFEALMFEAASALGTVGLSMGITSSLSELGKFIVVMLMFCGRVGPLTFGAALFLRSAAGTKTLDNDLAV
jgi:trk system potassium uptake protein TrkH